MTKGPRTEKQMEADCEAGNRLAGLIIGAHMEGQSVYVVYNALGVIVSSVFASAEFKEPQHALEEFDHWVAYTREHLASIIKERMQ